MGWVAIGDSLGCDWFIKSCLFRQVTIYKPTGKYQPPYAWICHSLREFTVWVYGLSWNEFSSSWYWELLSLQWRLSTRKWWVTLTKLVQIYWKVFLWHAKGKKGRRYKGKLKNRRKIGKSIVLSSTKIASLHHLRAIIKVTSPQLVRSHYLYCKIVNCNLFTHGSLSSS